MVACLYVKRNCTFASNVRYGSYMHEEYTREHCQEQVSAFSANEEKYQFPPFPPHLIAPDVFRDSQRAVLVFRPFETMTLK